MNQAAISKVKNLLRFAIIVLFSLAMAIVLAVYIFGWVEISDKAVFSSLSLGPKPANQLYDKELVPGIKKETLYIDCPGGAKIHCWLFRVPGSDRLAIVNHGNAGNISNRIGTAQTLTKAGLSVLLYDYRGYGLSTGGKPRVDWILQDGLTVYDCVHDRLHYSPEHIFLYGESIGSGVTCFVANRRQCGAVILQSGIASLPAAAKGLFPILNVYPDFVIPEPHLDNVAAVQSIHVPILIIHGRVDHTVSFLNSEQLFEKSHQPKTLVLLPHCAHNDVGIEDAAQFNEAIQSFVNSIR